MNNNITPDMLIQYLDNELDPQDRVIVENELAADPALQQQLERLRLAQDAVKHYARKQQVSAIHRQVMQERSSAPVGKMRWTRAAMRVAAILVILLLVAGIVQYSLLDTDRLYSSQYEAYALGVNRSNEEVSPVEEAYRRQNMQQVITLYSNEALRRPTDHFLAGQAYLSNNDPHKAIAAFNAQLSANASLTFKPYQEDTEYYLALAYLKAGDVNRALPLFENIHRQPAHAYHREVSGWYLTQLRWLKGKIS